jgi:hypothetical protein
MQAPQRAVFLACDGLGTSPTGPVAIAVTAVNADVPSAAWPRFLVGGLTAVHGGEEGIIWEERAHQARRGREHDRVFQGLCHNKRTPQAFFDLQITDEGP